MFCIPDLQVSDIKRLLIDVDGVSASRQPAHRSQVATVPPHGLDDEDSPLGATGRLLDAVARLIHTDFMLDKNRVPQRCNRNTSLCFYVKVPLRSSLDRY